jgi:hypothetical protein
MDHSEYGLLGQGNYALGVEEYLLDLNAHLRVWPNPVAHGQALQLSFTPPPEFAPNGPLRAVRLDATGRTLQQETVPSGVSAFRFQLSPFSFPTLPVPLHLTNAPNPTPAPVL